MKNLIKPLFFLSLVLLLSSCSKWETIRGEGPIVQESFDVNNFDGVILEGSFDVVVTLGVSQSIVAEGQQNIIDRLQVFVQNDGSLILSLEDGNYQNIDLTIYVSVPTADKFEVTGSGDMIVHQSSDPLFQEIEDLKIEVTGSGDFTGVGQFLVQDHANLRIKGSGNLTLDLNSSSCDGQISGSGDMYLSGSTNSQDALITGSGNYDAFEFLSTIAEAKIMGSGNINIHVSDELNATIQGSGNIRYEGQPNLNYTITGSGDLRKIN